MEEREEGKLVRDLIPQIIRENGKQPIIETMGDEDYNRHLNMKLGEELEEYLEQESVEELADMVEVIYAILAFKSISLDEFEEIRTNKLEERGGFKERIYLKGIIEE